MRDQILQAAVILSQGNHQASLDSGFSDDEMEKNAEAMDDLDFTEDKLLRSSALDGILCIL